MNPTQRVIKGGSQCVQIGGRPKVSSFEILLEGRVGRGQGGRKPQIAAAHLLCGAKINQYRAVVGEHQIVWLDVAVQ